MNSSSPPKASYLTRVRLIGLCSVLLAPLWCFAAYRVFRHILHLEFVAIMGLAIGGGMAAGAANHGEATGLVGALMINPAVVEGSAHTWLGLMYIIGALVFLGGAMGLAARPSARRWLLAAAIAILAGTLLTLAGVHVLIRWGGFPPTVKPLGYLVIAAVQSFYGWVLLLACWRKPQPAA